MSMAGAAAGTKFFQDKTSRQQSRSLLPWPLWLLLLLCWLWLWLSAAETGTTGDETLLLLGLSTNRCWVGHITGRSPVQSGSSQ